MGKIFSRRHPGIESEPTPVQQAPMSYTPKQLQEIVRCSKDPRYFIDTYLSVIGPKGVTQFSTRSYQQTQLRAFAQFSTFCLQPRQSGATSIPLAYQLWEALFNIDTQHGTAFVKHVQAVEGMKLVQYWLDNLPIWLKPNVKYRNQTNLEFDNGSRIIVGTITANFNRGRSWTTLFVDCLAFADPQHQEDFWLAAIPSVLPHGRMFITGVPNGSTNTFAHVWANITSMQHSNFTPMHVDPLSVYSQLELDSIRALIGDRNFKREYDCEFLP